MKISRFMIPTLKEIPAEATIASHQLMLRAGLIRKMTSGVYSWLPLGYRALRKLEEVIREEMDRAGAQEFHLPLIVPSELWEETGRYTVMGDLMMKVRDRGGKDFVLSPTQEEGFTHLVRGELQSYKQLPFTLYQINKKYRDELRPRFGVMRGREFTMKDAYSFDKDAAGLDASYEAMRQAYERLFRRVGLETVGVKADSGAMGGSGSQEFMVPSQVGEDEIIVCRGCGYAANTETAVCRETPGTTADCPPPAEVATPGVRTIEELVGFFKTTPDRFLKTLVYSRVADGKTVHVLAVIRGDLEVNPVKLANLLGAPEVYLADDETVVKVTGAPVGFAGPVGLSGIRIIADNSVAGVCDGFTGANKKDAHLAHVDPARDLAGIEFADLRLVRAGDTCASCGASLDSFRGIEVGHIFKLGYKYTEAMNVVFQDEAGGETRPIMGCYGIGVDRTLASIIEQHHDDDGIIWPLAVAPFQVLIVPVNYDEPATRKAADSLHDALAAQGVEVLLDDRDARPGVKFKDADLIGIPLRVTIGDRGLAKGEVELKDRAGGIVTPLPVEGAAGRILEVLAGMGARDGG